MRHRSLILILCWPLRRPNSFSNRFAGGIRRSPRDSAESSMTSFRWATRWTAGGKLRERCRRKMRSVSRSRKLRITSAMVTGNVNNATRYVSSTSASPGRDLLCGLADLWCGSSVFPGANSVGGFGAAKPSLGPRLPQRADGARAKSVWPPQRDATRPHDSVALAMRRGVLRTGYLLG